MLHSITASSLFSPSTIIVATCFGDSLYWMFFPVFVSRMGVSVYPTREHSRPLQPGQTMFTYTPYGVSIVRRATHHPEDRSEPSPNECAATLQEEYIGLMKFIPRPATEERMQIWPWRRSLIESITGNTVFLHVRMFVLIM